MKSASSSPTLAENREGPLPEGRLQQETDAVLACAAGDRRRLQPKDNPKIPQWEMFLSGGAAAMNLVIAANAMGYGDQLDHQLVFRRGGRATHSWPGTA